MTIFTLYYVHVDYLYLSMIYVEHAHYLVAMQDHVQINIYKYTPLPVSCVIRGSLRLAQARPELEVKIILGTSLLG